ncbi:MAG: 4-hydroxythreonine-4-phosphate dehydrogenase PdxA [Bacteroidales bacterium]|jgi:4-hydroxythreonine-4-phosphate dehydrogenase|nr:4-hydroxythreonine-4-phosphate dehydrogenase PdxA [Bacteroidales bacterium]
MKDRQKLCIGITQGDINGIGCEVILKTLNDARMSELCTPVLYSSPKIVAYFRKSLSLTSLNVVSVKSAAEAQDGKINIVNCLSDEVYVDTGKSTEMGGQAALASLQTAVKEIKDRFIDALVTAPINKHNIQSEHFRFHGHTEYLQSEFGNEQVLMLMVSDRLRIGMMTGHIPLSEVPQSVTQSRIVDALRLLNRTMPADFNLNRPKIAVLSLNPHAGDNGVIGDEEQRIIIPAVEQAKNEKILAFGPYPSDGFFGSENYRKFDAILAMYHDQGMTAFKTLCFESGVNYTAGLPVVRTSPAHGTAYDLAGKDMASPESFRQAMYLACDIAKNRKRHRYAVNNDMKGTNVKEAKEAKDDR